MDPFKAPITLKEYTIFLSKVQGEKAFIPHLA
jgi:hypothetical protein